MQQIVTLTSLRDALKRLNLLANRGRIPLDLYVEKEREVEVLVKGIREKTKELEQLAQAVIEPEELKR